MAINAPYISSTQVASSTPFDNVAAPTFTSTDVQAALKEIRDQSVLDSTTTATSTNGTLTLTTSSLTEQFLTGSATGYTIQLPNATSLPLSIQFTIINTSSQHVQIQDGSGANLFVLGQTSIGYALLQINGSAAGTWVWWQLSVNVSNGIVSYNIVSNTTFSSSAAADTLITGMTVTPQAGTYGIWFNSEATGTGSGQQLDVTVYNNGSAITDSKRSNLSTSGGHIFQQSTQTISQFSGTAACEIRINPNGNSMSVGSRSLLLIRLGT